MKKIFGLIVIATIFVFTSCDELGLEGIPIEHNFEETFVLTIDENTPSHVGDTVDIDLSELDEFADVTDEIQSIEIKTIALDIIEFTAPEDLHISGVLIASDDAFENSSLDVAAVPPLNLFDYFSSGEQVTLEIDSSTVNTLSGWLVEKSAASIAYDFALLNSEFMDYEFTEADNGGSLKIKVTVGIKAVISGLPDLGLGL